MKQARRKELKTNELGAYLQQIQEAAVRNSNYIIGGVVVVVLILVIGLYVQSRRHQAETARWAELRQIQEEASAEIKAETIDRARRLADETAGDPKLGPAARALHAELAYQRALDVSPVSDPKEYTRLLNEARAGYQTLIDTYKDMPLEVARGRLGLAYALESLHVVGEAQLDDVRRQYQLVVDSGQTPFDRNAADRLGTLAERTRPLQIVATRPAEPPATAPAEELSQTPVIQPAEIPAEAPAETPDVTPAETPDETPADEQTQPVPDPADQPAEEPAAAPQQ